MSQKVICTCDNCGAEFDLGNPGGGTIYTVGDSAQRDLCPDCITVVMKALGTRGP